MTLSLEAVSVDEEANSELDRKPPRARPIL